MIWRSIQRSSAPHHGYIFGVWAKHKHPRNCARRRLCRGAGGRIGRTVLTVGGRFTGPATWSFTQRHGRRCAQNAKAVAHNNDDNGHLSGKSLHFPERLAVLQPPDPAAQHKTIVAGRHTALPARGHPEVPHRCVEPAKFSGAKLHAVLRGGPPRQSGSGSPTPRGVQFGIETVRGAAEDVKKQLLADADRQGVSAEMDKPQASHHAEALIKVAEAVNADLLVLGNRGMTGMTRFVLGEHSEQGLSPRSVQPADHQYRRRRIEAAPLAAAGRQGRSGLPEGRFIASP